MIHSVNGNRVLYDAQMREPALPLVAQAPVCLAQGDIRLRLADVQSTFGVDSSDIVSSIPAASATLFSGAAWLTAAPFAFVIP